MRKLVLAAVTLPAALLLGAGTYVAVRVHHSLAISRAQLAEEGKLVFDITTITHIDNPGFEPLATPANYTGGAMFHGKLYLAGSGGLAEYVTLEASPRLLRPGLDLPPAPIVSITTGVLRGVGHPELILATRGEGVLLYDGTLLRRLRPKLAAARDITAILPLTSGDLLLGTRELGLLLYDGKTLTPFHANLSNLAITALAGDAGDLWIGTRNRGVFHWHAGQLDHFDATSGLPDQQVESLALTPGKAFVGTPLGVAEFDAGRPGRTLAPGLFAHALATDGATLTIASIDQGIYEVPLTESRVRHAAASSATLEVTNLIVTGSELLAITPSGLSRRERSGEWQSVLTATPSTLADGNIAALSFAPDGHLWIGYFDRGLDILALTGEPAAQHLEDDRIFCINRILPDPTRHTMDVATANGLVLFDPTGHPRQTLLRRDGLIADQITDIALTRDGLALATPAGLTFIDATGTHSLYAFHGLVNNHVYTLASDSNNHMLAGTLGGISLLNDGVVHANMTTRNSGLKQNWITAIVPVSDDSQNNFFVGTYGSGVMQLDALGHITAMEGATRPAEINPNAMLVTPQHVFAGTLGDGLLVYNRATHHWARLTAGLPSLNVTAFAEREGQIYVGTENGIVHIAESRLDQ
jgi:hypothetical protein